MDTRLGKRNNTALAELSALLVLRAPSCWPALASNAVIRACQEASMAFSPAGRGAEWQSEGTTWDLGLPWDELNFLL